MSIRITVYRLLYIVSVRFGYLFIIKITSLSCVLYGHYKAEHLILYNWPTVGGCKQKVSV